MPFVPPSKEYISLEQMVERFPNWGYQLYFREKSTNAEIERHVRSLPFLVAPASLTLLLGVSALQVLQVDLPPQEEQGLVPQ